MIDLQLLTENACRKLNSECNSNLNLINLKHSTYGYQIAMEFMHYYRMRDIYEIYNQNKRYKRKYYFKYYDYEGLFKNGFNKNQMNNQLLHLRSSKNEKIKIYVSNYQFYKRDKNKSMFIVTCNLLETMYNYADYFDNLHTSSAELNHFNPDIENHYLNDMIYAFHLYYTMLDKEMLLSSDEMDKLMNEKHDIKKSLVFYTDFLNLS